MPGAWAPRTLFPLSWAYSHGAAGGAPSPTELPAGLSAWGPAEVLGRPCQARWQSGWAGPAAGWAGSAAGWAGPWRLQCAMAAPVEAAGGANRAGLVPGTRLFTRKLHWTRLVPDRLRLDRIGTYADPVNYW